VVALQPAGDAIAGLNEPGGALGRGLARGLGWSRRPLERVTAGGESPVGERPSLGVTRDREYRRTREIRREAGRTTAQG
jgi:hypothetical protein